MTDDARPPDYDGIVEGLCPHGHGQLDRREDYGWCETCRSGWSISGRTISLHIMPDTSAFDEAMSRVRAVLDRHRRKP